MDAILQSIRDLFGGGQLSLWMIIAGVIAVWLAVKAVRLVVRIALVGVAAALFLGTVPWAGTAVEGAAADCAAAEVAASASGWQSQVTKRVTTEEVSPDAACRRDGTGLRAGTATVRLRTFYDVPFQTWDVTPEGAEPRLDLPVS